LSQYGPPGIDPQGRPGDADIGTTVRAARHAAPGTGRLGSGGPRGPRLTEARHSGVPAVYVPKMVPYTFSDPGSGTVYTASRSLAVPFVIEDDWAFLPDGTVAVVRGRDFHLEFYGTDGVKTSTRAGSSRMEALD